MILYYQAFEKITLIGESFARDVLVIDFSIQHYYHDNIIHISLRCVHFQCRRTRRNIIIILLLSRYNYIVYCSSA